MTENENLIGVLAEIDRAIEADPGRRAGVAAVLPAYRGRGAVGWFHRFETWVADRSSADAGFPPIDQALAALARQPPDDVPRPAYREPPEIAAPDAQAPEPPLSLQGQRRAGALAALAAALPERFGPQGRERDSVLAAVGSLARERGHDQADDLLRRHRDADLRSPASASFRAHLLLGETGAGNVDPIPVLRTESPPLLGRRVRRVEEFLEPRRWQDLGGSFWESMTPVDNLVDDNLVDDEPRCYREVFVVTPRFKLRPVLEVVSRQLSFDPPARSLEYRLCTHSDHDHHHDLEAGDRGVVRDEGSIVNRQLDGWSTVSTTKRVAFDGPFDGPALVMVAHALGYLEAFEGMVAAALALTDQNQ